MNKKKLIGTIIGVVLFAALIAGATFAWLTISLNVTNGDYIYNTTKFVINYQSETTDLGGELPTLQSPTASAAKDMVVSAYRNEFYIDELTGKKFSIPNGILYLKVTSDLDNFITRGGVINYAVCSGSETTSDCNGLTTGQTGVLSTGAITNVGEQIIYETKDPDKFEAGPGVGIPTTETFYWIYFWIDPAKVSEEMLEETYQGHVHASAEQR